MKKVIIFLLTLFVLLSCGNQSKDVASETDKASAQITEEENITKESLAPYFIKKGATVKLKDALPNGKGLYVYFQMIGGKAKNLKLYIKYGGYDIYQFNIDGERYTYKTDKSKGRGEAKESWYDYTIKTIDMKFLRSLLHSQSARVVFSDGTSELITEDIKIAIKRTLDYFEILGGEFPPYI